MQISPEFFAEELARLFYHYRELLACDFGFQSSEGSQSWEELLPNHRNLMVATTRLVLLHLATSEDITRRPAPAELRHRAKAMAGEEAA